MHHAMEPSEIAAGYVARPARRYELGYTIVESGARDGMGDARQDGRATMSTLIGRRATVVAMRANVWLHGGDAPS